MEFAIFEMDEEKSVKDEVFSKNLNQTDFDVKLDVPLTEVTDSLVQHGMKTSKDVISIQEKFEKVAQPKIDSVLLNNKRMEHHSLTEENSIILPIKSSTSLNDLSNNKFLKSQILSVDTDLKGKSLHKSSSCSDIRLPLSTSSSSFSCTSLNMVSNNVREPLASSEREQLQLIQNDKKENLEKQ